MKLCDFVVSSAIIPEISEGPKESVIRAMVASLREAGSIKSSDEEGIVSAILKREELGSTGIGRGVAVPHTKHASVDKLIAAIAISKVG
ncbi:MAG: PTS sugar transporter subunit IIA, partial [Planctomycetes bacterium]|nr:PTS sugar transporter subunit IIA [Planctomycetota bacterium]